MTLNAWTGNPDSDSPQSKLVMGAPLKLAAERIMDMLDNFEYAVLSVMQGQRSPDEPAKMKTDICSAIEQALAARVPDVPDAATPGEWFVRTRVVDGEVVDCFVAAPDCQGLPYDAEILGDDEYRGTIDRKLADCQLIVSSVNAARAMLAAYPPPQQTASPDLRKAAQAVVDRWDSLTWGGSAANLRHTGEYIAELRKALQNTEKKQ